ncbi:LtfC-like domain-containing protein [Nocardia sp. NPDC004711]
MANIGDKLPSDTVWLTGGRDFECYFEHLDANRQPIDFPVGSLFFELDTVPTKTLWTFTITGSQASLKVESTASDLIAAGTIWQLVFLPQGETAGGRPLALGRIARQGE